MSKHREPYKGFRKEANAAARKSQAYREASAEPLPGPLADAFAGLPEAVAGLRVRPMVHFDFVLLKIIKSPLLEHLARQAGTKGKVSTGWSDEQGWEMVWQFTRPPEEVHAWLAQQPPAKVAANYRAMVTREIGMKLGPFEVVLLIRMAQKAFVDAFSTMLQYVPKDEEKGGLSFPTPPVATASAGGSATSAG